MKATLKIEADTEDKLRLLIRVAEEMGIEVKASSLKVECLRAGPFRVKGCGEVQSCRTPGLISLQLLI